MPIFRNTVKVFCAFCRSPKRVPSSKRIAFRHITGAILAASLTMVLIWREFDPRALMIFVVYLAIAEVFVQIRWRMSLSCRQCGFDPVIYKKNAEVAAEKVKDHLLRRKQDPRYLLYEPLNLPVRRIPPPPQPGEPQRGRLISKQI